VVEQVVFAQVLDQVAALFFFPQLHGVVELVNQRGVVIVAEMFVAGLGFVTETIKPS
jgi:hypothetical protein